jgi:hypothetical protein
VSGAITKICLSGLIAYSLCINVETPKDKNSDEFAESSLSCG